MTGRLFSIFEDANESVLLQQCQDDLSACGFDSFQSRTFAAEILQQAKATLTTEMPMPSAAMTVENTNNNVTVEDTKWYGSLPPLARAVMHSFDEVIRGQMWFQCHAVNLCLEDLDRDLRQRLPTFGSAGVVEGDDAPLPWELRRRFSRFVDKTKKNEQAWRDWGERSRRASSMNALIREEIRAGRL